MSNIVATAGETLDNILEKDEQELREDIIRNIQTVFDPEIPVNIFDLGLIYAIDIKDNRDADVEMTLTSPACPVAGILPHQVAHVCAAVEGIGKVDIKLVWDPPWTPDQMSPDAQLALDFGFGHDFDYHDPFDFDYQ